MHLFTKQIPMLVLTLTMLGAMAVPVSAKNEEYYFKIVGDQTRTYKISTKATNEKTIPGDPATVHVGSKTTFPANGYVWAFRLYRNEYSATTDAENTSYKPATNAIFVRGYGTFHPTYMSGQNLTERLYYIGGRLDDRVDDPNAYVADGVFNADYTTP